MPLPQRKKKIVNNPVTPYSITFNLGNLKKLIKRMGINIVIKNAKRDIEKSIREIENYEKVLIIATKYKKQPLEIYHSIGKNLYKLKK